MSISKYVEVLERNILRKNKSATHTLVSARHQQYSPLCGLSIGLQFTKQYTFVAKAVLQPSFVTQREATSAVNNFVVPEASGYKQARK